MATAPTPPPQDPSNKSLGDLVSDVSIQTSSLVREKVNELVKGSVVGIAAGTFAFLALILIMHGIAWLLNDLFFDSNWWLGFFVEALIFLIVAGIAGMIAAKAFKKGAPPTPDLAIEEAKRTRAALTEDRTEGL
jgi:cobalamin biosynthesis protein CobD/CbiB